MSNILTQRLRCFSSFFTITLHSQWEASINILKSHISVLPAEQLSSRLFSFYGFILEEQEKLSLGNIDPTISQERSIFFWKLFHKCTLTQKTYFPTKQLQIWYKWFKTYFYFCLQKILKLQENLRTIQVLNYIYCQ